MSILECEKGEEIFVTTAFFASPKGVSFSLESDHHHFQVGEAVVYIDYTKDKSGGNDGWVNFLANDGKFYDALPGYFSTKEDYEDFTEYFGNDQ